MPKFSIETKRTVRETKEIELTFPLYLKYDGTYNSETCEEWITVSKVEENGKKFKVLKITKNKHYNSPGEYEIQKHEEVSLEYFREYFAGGDFSYDYSYSNDPSEFNRLFNEVVETIGMDT